MAWENFLSETTRGTFKEIHFKEINCSGLYYYKSVMYFYKHQYKKIITQSFKSTRTSLNDISTCDELW